MLLYRSQSPHFSVPTATATGSGRIFTHPLGFLGTWPLRAGCWLRVSSLIFYSLLWEAEHGESADPQPLARRSSSCCIAAQSL